MPKTAIEQTLGAFLNKHKLWIATAESCTGGLIANRITNVSGSSNYFLGGTVTYSNQAKMKWLHVQEDTLIQHGAVSRETVMEMALGLANELKGLCKPDQLITLSVSGIAGPTGGTPKKPVGLVWIGWSFKNEVRARSFHFQGTRTSIKEQSADEALSGALQWLQEIFLS
jgi:PncC family amidohydrolase